MEILEGYILTVSDYIIVLNVLLYGYSAIKLKYISSLKLLALYLFCICVINFWMGYLSSLKENNLFLFHAYLILQFVTLSFFYKSIFNKRQNVAVNFILVFSILALGVNYGFILDRFSYFNAPEILITTTPILTYIFIHLYNSLTVKGKYLIFSSGLLMYLTISTLVWILYAVAVAEIDGEVGGIGIILDKQTSKVLSSINTVGYFLLQIVIFMEWKLNISKWRTSKK